MASTLQEPFKKELEWLQEQQVIVPPGVDEISEWHNNFILVNKLNGGV